MVLTGVLIFGVSSARAEDDTSAVAGCKELPDHDALQAALIAAQATPNGGLGFNMWGAIVNRDGIVCAVAMTGGSRGD